MERRTAFDETYGGPNGARSDRALMADLELLRGLDDRRMADARRGSCRTVRRSYLYDMPDVSPRRIRRQTGIALVAILLLAALLAGWGLIELIRWAAAGIGSGLTPRLAPGALGAVMMTLPRA